MKRFFSPHSLNIFSLELEKWDFPVHNHNFYELIFIETGKGKHMINSVTFDYKKGDIFLLPPNDEHHFEVEEKTVFTFIKFTEQIFAEKNENVSKNKWMEKIQPIFSNPNSVPEVIVKDEREKLKAFQLLDLFRKEFELKDTFSSQMVLELFGALLVLVARNINHKMAFNPLVKSEYKAENILAYIRGHILEKEKLTIDAIADKFYIAPNYVSTFIRKHAGISLRKIVIETKLKMAERLLTNSKLTISEISSRLKFNDASHFTKTFKKYRKINPKDFRKKRLENNLKKYLD